MRGGLTNHVAGHPAGIGSGLSISHADSLTRQNVLFCAFVTDPRLTVEATQIGGYRVPDDRGAVTVGNKAPVRQRR